MTLRLVHTNDLHDRFPEKTVKKLAGGDTLLLDSGDAIGGSNTAFRLREPILARMREAGYAAMAMGNREFHYLRGVLAGRQRAAGFPILAANLSDLRKKLTVADRLTILKNGVAVGLFGLTVPQYPAGSPWEKWAGWRFSNPVETAAAVSEKLRSDGAQIVICLSHLGLAADLRLAESGARIDLILGGHSHTILPRPLQKNGAAVIQGGAYGRFVGFWEIKAEGGGWTVDGELVRSDGD